MNLATLAATAVVFALVAWVMAFSAMGMMTDLQTTRGRAADQCAAIGELCGGQR